MRTLLLWDIDGTLLNSSGAGVEALRLALHHVFAIDGSLQGIEFAGRTDRWIMRQIFTRFEVPATEANLQRLTARYAALLPQTLSERRVELLPGIPAILEEARSRGDVALGLLTGNLRCGAEAKLRSRDLWRFFPFGAFGDDSEDRNLLGPHALHRAHQHCGVNFAPQSIWVIGDTPHDVGCARACGARALAVATGQHKHDALRASRPDAFLPDCGDSRAFWGIIESGGANPVS